MPARVDTDTEKMAPEYFGEGGEFHQYYQKLKNSLSQREWAAFGQLSTPRDKIEFCRKLSGIDDIKVFVSKSMKDAEQALKLKEKGNEAFKERRYEDAFHFYTSALQHCPVNEENPADPKNRDYSVILANR